MSRESFGPGDHAFLLGDYGVPSYIKTPTGAIRVLEYAGGSTYSIRTIFGAPVANPSWLPSDAVVKRSRRR